MMKEEKRAVLVAFSVQSGKFESLYERNKFFRGLYGWKQMIRKEVIVSRSVSKSAGNKQKTKAKVYTYRREGLLDEIPHEKVDQSSFIVPEDDFGKIMKFFKEWRDKVMWKSFKVLLDEDFKEFFKMGLEEDEDEEDSEEESTGEEVGEEGVEL